MRVHCEQCNLDFDDLYSLTFCPHEAFPMRTHVTREDGKERVCTSMEELIAFFEKGKRPREPRPYPFKRPLHV